MPESARERNERILRAYLNGELLAARGFVEDRLAHLFTGLLGRLVNPLAKSLYHAIGEAEVRKRINLQFDCIAVASRDAAATGVEAAIATWTERSLDTEEVVHRGNRQHPRFPDVLALLREGFAERVRAVDPLLAYGGEVATYDDLVRAVYPDPAEPLRVIANQVALARRVTALVKANPRLLHFPAALQGHLWPLVEDVTRWYEGRAEAEFRRIYGR